MTAAISDSYDGQIAAYDGMLDTLGLPVAALQAGDDEPHDEPIRPAPIYQPPPAPSPPMRAEPVHRPPAIEGVPEA